MTDGMLSLSWNNHSTTFCHTLASLRAKERYTDVTLACDGKFYPVHKLVLSTCSEYFENMFEHTPCKHPVVVLRDVQNDELEALLSYMYAGVVSVAQSDLARLIKVAELLQIKGLAVPDEPPNSSKKAYNQRTSDDRTSPHLRSRHSYERNSPYAKSKQSQSSCDDGSSPHPKRRRRLESDTSHEDIQSTHNSPSKAMDGERLQEDLSAWNEDQDTRQRSEVESEERTDYHSTTQDPLTAKVQVNLDESLVKEEIIDDPRDSQNDSSEPGHNYDGMTGDSSGGGQDPVSLMVPKYDHVPPDQEMLPQSGLGQPPPLHEAVIEALAGPSGMQAWPGGGDMARRLALGEGFGGESNQDFTSLSLGQPSTQAHQLVRMARGDHRTSKLGVPGDRPRLPSIHIREKPFYCSLCPYQMSNDSTKRHQCSHIGKVPYSCPYCPFRASHSSKIQCHLRTHTGEKPYACHLCPSRFAKKGNLKTHIRTHTGETICMSPLSILLCS
ncbi:protein tramtrack, beta isoform-like isoform X2 [Homarus americanus]|uniref:protein tramtrack, beta isoform-like isoform X2 n=1 Tax=Homarus americanus TaxID=6706 RepID=UPI001C4744D4|nr:protein tramtrack, beta isoform-like isoform X2 [Homarus americanus]